MKRYAAWFIGGVIGATALGAVGTPALADSSRDDSKKSDRPAESQRLRDAPSSRSSSSSRLLGGSSGRDGVRMRGDSRSGGSAPVTLGGSRSTHQNEDRGLFGDRLNSDRRSDAGMGSRMGSRASDSSSVRIRTVDPVRPSADASNRSDVRLRQDPSSDSYRRDRTRSDPGSILGGSRTRQDSSGDVYRRDRTRSDPGSILGGSRSHSDRSIQMSPPVQTPGITRAGRVLGSSEPVDAQGRTSVGRALGAGTIPIEPSRGSVTYRGHEPRYGYNPYNGRYEPYHHGTSVFIGVLLGTAASRPSYSFRYHHNNGVYYYPYYCDDVISAGFYPSPYFYFGFGPAYIPATRVVVVDRPIIIHEDVDDDADGYYLNREDGQSVDDTLSDIKHAWVDEDIDLILRHLRSDQDVYVYLKGKYQYSLPSSDYRDLTQDAMTNSTTTSFKWVSVDRKSDVEVRATAEHRFDDKDGDSHKVYASFTLTKIHGAWWIAEVGSSNQIDD